MQTKVEVLTDREKQVMRLIKEGMTNQEIAKQLFLSVATVNTHVHNILQKLECKDRKKLIAYY